MGHLYFGYYQLILAIFPKEEVEVFQKRLIKPAIDKMIAGLESRDQKVLQMRFGLLDGKVITLQKVGNIYGVGRERIRQVQKNALRLLRCPARRRELKARISEIQ